MLTLGFVLDLTFSYLYYLWFPETKKLPWELRFLTQAREIYGKSITILFRYKINQRQTQQMDPIAINTTSNGQHLILMGQTPLSTA